MAGQVPSRYPWAATVAPSGCYTCGQALLVASSLDKAKATDRSDGARCQLARGISSEG
ncbi:hypothetical protein ACLOJK_006701, partial [Asimina triloba]